MSRFPERRRTALLVVDMQVAVVAQAWRRAEVIEAIAGLVAKARGAAAPVIWIRHCNAGLRPGWPEWRIVPELAPGADEQVIDKRYNDAFAETALEGWLAAQEVGAVVVCGAQSDACVRATLYGALHRGFDVWLAADAHTTEDLTADGAPPPGLVIAHTNLTWGFNRLPGQSVAARNATEIEF